MKGVGQFCGECYYAMYTFKKILKWVHIGGVRFTGAALCGANEALADFSRYYRVEKGNRTQEYLRRDAAIDPPPRDYGRMTYCCSERRHKIAVAGILSREKPTPYSESDPTLLHKGAASQYKARR